MTYSILIIICREFDIKGYNRKKKKELIEMIQQKDTTMDSIIKNKDENNIKTNSSIKEKIKIKMTKDRYTEELLKEQYNLHKSYVIGRIETIKITNVKVRLPCIPEDISENIIKYIIHSKLNDKTSTWDCAKGDLQSQKEGNQECKCFTSNGPASFTPTSDWDVIYFLDARNWLNDIFILYRIELKRTSNEWKNIKVSKAQTFDDQCKQGRRPRITWESLYPQIENYCMKVYEGNLEDIYSS
jgi:hypothetical protein